jgi:prevent-host-death family protein
MKTVGLFEAKTHLATLVDQVQEEGKIILTRRGKPVAELRPVESNGSRKFGASKGCLLYMAPDFNEPIEDFKDYQ